MALTDKLTAIGDAIRAKTGETALLKLDDMPTAIAGIQTGSDGDNMKAFLNDELVEYKIPDGVYTLGDGVFSYKKALTKVDLNEVTTVGTNCFYACSNLVEVDFSKVQKVTGANILSGTKVTTLDLASIQNLGKSSGGYTRYFQGSDNLEEVINFVPKYLEAYIFFSCKKLNKIDLTELLEVGMSSLGTCQSFGDVVLPKIQKIGQSAFSTATTNINRTKIDIGADCVSIAAEAFKDSANVTAVIVRATTPPTLSNVNAFNFIPTTAGDHGKYIYVPKASLETYWNATNWSAFVGSGLTYRAIEDYPEITGG